MKHNRRYVRSNHPLKGTINEREFMAMLAYDHFDQRGKNRCYCAVLVREDMVPKMNPFWIKSLELPTFVAIRMGHSMKLDLEVAVQLDRMEPGNLDLFWHKT